jgi:hypothetical protein
VLRVIGERPGVTAPELAAASEVTGGTLYSLLRRLTQEGTLDKRELPGGRTGYAVAASPTAERAGTSIKMGAAAKSKPAPGPRRDRAGTTDADVARSSDDEAQTSAEQPKAPADSDETTAQQTRG